MLYIRLLTVFYFDLTHSSYTVSPLTVRRYF